MKEKKAFTIPEIVIVVLISSVVLGVLYQIFSGVLGQFFKNSSKMSNLRAASLILERLKSDIRCAVIPANSEEAAIVEDKKKLQFYTTSFPSKDSEKKKVIYTYSGNELKRDFDNSKSVNIAKVKDFRIIESESSEKNKYITIKITVDNEVDKNYRSESSKKNEIELKAVLYPRFYKESLTDEEKFWFRTRYPDL